MKNITTVKDYQKFVKRKKTIIVFLQIGIFILFLLLWELLTKFEILNSFIFSSPSKVIALLINYLQTGELINHVYISTLETIISLFVSITLGFTIATLLFLNDFISKIFDPYLVLLNALPKSAIAPILIIWLGATQKGIIGVSISFVIVIVILNTLNNFKHVDNDLIVLLKSMNATKLQILLKVVFPSNMINILSTVKVCIGLSWVGVIVGEFLASRNGIGYLIMYGGQVFKLDLVMMGIFILCVIAFFMYGIVVIIEKAIKKKYHF